MKSAAWTFTPTKSARRILERGLEVLMVYRSRVWLSLGWVTLRACGLGSARLGVGDSGEVEGWQMERGG